MAKIKGHYLPLSLPRRFVGDLLYFARKVPSCPVQREMNVAQLCEVRADMQDPVSWCAIFTKAYARAAEQFPELRRAYMGFPWARLYEHPSSVASVAVEREYQGEKAVFFAHMRTPEKKDLRDFDRGLRRIKEEPVERFGLFRRAMKVSRLPWPLRRLIWWVGLNSSGAKRAKRMGTFGVSVYSSLGAESLHPLSPLTTALNYGVIGKDGSVNVRVVYDHRVMDGSTVARALAFMEKVLNEEILAEIKNQPLRRAA
jgi:hypothetical protein